MLNAGFRAAGLPMACHARQLTAGELQAAVQGVRSDPTVRGIGVMMPFTRSVLKWLDGLQPPAKELGAVNTIRHRADSLVGWNTDRDAFARALNDAGYDPAGRTVLVLGAGGAARAVVAVLRGLAGRLWVVSRDLEEARSLCRELEVGRGGATPLGSLSLVVPRSDLVVNATPVGMDGRSVPVAPEWLTPNHFLFDLVYDPPQTPLVIRARARGARAVGGADMLYYQATASFQIWTDRQAPAEAMRAGLERAIKERETA